MTAAEQLKSELDKIGLEISDDQLQQLDQYRRLLWQWNQKLNLTRHDTIEKFVQRDVYDTFKLSTLLHQGEEVLDAGTGGGVPGIILKIIRPDLQMNLAESVGKKAAVITKIAEQLSLDVTIYNGRAEHILEDFRFDALVARAVGPLWKMCFWFQDLWPAVGRLLAIKGPAWIDERKEAREKNLLRNVDLRCALTYPMLGTDSESVILKIWPKGTPEK